MKSVVIEKPGSYDKLLTRVSENPSIKENEVLIECKACGVNFADCCVRMGVYSSAKVYVGWPITPGFEVSGVIKEVGRQVLDLNIGDRVVAITRFGGYTSHLAVNADQVFHLPDGVLFEEGAGFPTIFLTATYALEELVHPHPEQTILVHSAAGGVGSALVQLAKIAGCYVVGVVGGPHKVEIAKQLGADVVIDKSKQSLWEEAKKICPEGFDVILDANGPETLKQSYQHLASGGKLVVYGFHTMLSKERGTPNWFKVIWSYLRSPKFNPMNMTTDNRSVLAFNLSYLFKRKDLFRRQMNKLLELFQQEKVHLPKITTYPLEKVAEAHRDLESGKTIGKLVLIP
jgi:NADPH:quinone reductase-like Zn-dependent oxidoreductase